MFVSSALIGLNATMLNVALPDAVADLGASAFQGSWMVLAYMLFSGALLVLMGQVSDRYDPRRVFLSGLMTFVAASLTLVVAQDPWLFIVARAVQGAGGAMLLANSAAIVVLLFRGPGLGGAMGVYLAGFAVAQTAGPSIGGVATTLGSWRWIFILTLAVAALTLAFAWGILRSLPVRSSPSQAGSAVDWAGNALIFAAVAALLLGLSRAQDAGWLSVELVGPVLVSLVLLRLLLAVERRSRHPALDLALLRSRSFTSANYAGAVLIVPRLVTAILISLYLQGVVGDGPAEAALKITPLPAGVALGSLLGGRLTRYDERLVALCYSVVVLAGVGALLTWLLIDGPTALLLVALAVVGLSTGAFSTVNSTTILHEAPVERAGSVNAVRTLFQLLGTMVGTSLMLTLVAGGLAAGQAEQFLAGGHDRLSASTQSLLDQHFALAFVVMALMVLSAIGASVLLVRSPRVNTSG
ncbi:MFS transporter [Nocardioides sp. cx-169]|uniref:MFS transporter n=1 Tax=Nocardioides sp. cx-169 TaxID=2899080 RepID=UPI001E3FAA7A|nr:MFS transporter [Nocardioides sp. cx-169]MCD4534292.1 MFS transporter [Nocardioides sp. cx-169]